MIADISVYMPPSVLMEPDRIAPSHTWLGHIPFAFFLIHICQPRTLVELGTYSGNSYFAFCQAVKKLNTSTKCHAIDTWKGDKHGGLYGEDIFLDVEQYNQAHYTNFSTLHRSTFDDAQDDFEDGSIDMLHIDGLHTYEAVKHDFERWLPKLSDRAVVLFHDVCETRKDFGVWKFWEELERQYPSFMFEHSHGLGVLAVGKKVPNALLEFINLGKNQAKLIKKIYEKIGLNISLRLQTNEQQNEIMKLNAQIADKDAMLEKLCASTSWRITRPLRSFKERGLKLLKYIKPE